MAWTIAIENGHEGLTCLTDACKAGRFEKNEQETVDCSDSANHSKDECEWMRIGDSNLVDPNKGLHTYHSWFTLSRESIPKHLRDLGFDNYNIPRYFELKFTNAQASSVGQLEYNGAQLDMPASNLLGFSQWEADVSAGKSANYLSNLPYADPLDSHRASTCWASSTDDADAQITLDFASKQSVSKVAIRSYMPVEEDGVSEEYGLVRWVLEQLGAPPTLVPGEPDLEGPQHEQNGTFASHAQGAEVFVVDG